MQTFRFAPVSLRPYMCVTLLLFFCVGSSVAARAAVAKGHTVTLGAVRRVFYTPTDATPDEKAEDTTTLKVRPLLVDGRQRDWTVGEAHEVTDRSFTIRRVLRLNDALPTDPSERWVWQPGPWLLIDRNSGHITVLHLPEFDPLVSEATWYRDYAAYCGTSTTAKGGLYAVVAQLGARRAVVQNQIGGWPQPEHPSHVCQPAVWQRQPIRVTLQVTGGDPVTFDVVGTSSLIEDVENDER